MPNLKKYAINFKDKSHPAVFVYAIRQGQAWRLFKKSYPDLSHKRSDYIILP